MTVYSFYIFDRHTECVYQRRWTAPPLTRPTSNGTVTSTSTAANTSTPPSTSRPQSRSQTSRPSSTGPIASPPPASSASNSTTTTTTAVTQHHQFPTSSATAKTANDAKLLFGVVFSLRNLTRRLGGPADDFISYTTAQYKLHYFETATNLKFCMLTDPKTGNLRVVLHQIWANLWVEFVVRNPLSPAEHGSKAAAAHGGGGGVGNELFEMGLDRFVNQVFNPS